MKFRKVPWNAETNDPWYEEVWIATNANVLDDQFIKYEAEYPRDGYGTMMKVLYEAPFIAIALVSRRTSCD